MHDRLIGELESANREGSIINSITAEKARVHAIISRAVDEHREKKARSGRQDPTPESG